MSTVSDHIYFIIYLLFHVFSAMMVVLGPVIIIRCDRSFDHEDHRKVRETKKGINMDINEEAYAIQEEVVEFRRALHRCPEIAFHETMTMEYIREHLEEWEISYKIFDPSGNHCSCWQWQERNDRIKGRYGRTGSSRKRQDLILHL